MSSIPPGRRRLYWIFQVAGWGLWCAAGLWMVRQQIGSLNRSIITGYSLFFAFAIGLTHLLRHIITQRGWLTLSPARAVGRFVPATLITGVLLTAFVAIVSFVQHGAASDFARPAGLGWLAANLTFAAVLWMIFYVSMATWLRNREARQRAEALERRLADARLEALEAQMSPHFLFNCLNSLRGMIAENPARAQDMVTRLANILRHNLVRSGDGTTETLAAQIEIVTDYLELESVRFDERLRTRFDIDPDTRECAVPSMVLQTLVENAIKHGIAHLPDGGDVVIASRMVNGSLEIVVENSGTLRLAPAGSTQLGLANVRERLRMLHGARASLELFDGPQNRVHARMRLPAIHSRASASPAVVS